jgi:hypothetical protein
MIAEHFVEKAASRPAPFTPAQTLNPHLSLVHQSAWLFLASGALALLGAIYA